MFPARRLALSVKVLLVFGFVLASVPPAGHGQGVQPSYAPVGLEPGRGYFAALPFEAVDMVNGNLLLTFTDLVLPGNAGMDLRFVRTYNHNAAGWQWRFGFDGVPLIVELPNGPYPENPWEYPRLIMASGAAHQTVPRDTLDLSNTVFLTAEFWRYTTTTRTLELPNGWTATYTDVGLGGKAVLAQVTDPYGNTITPEWEAGDIAPKRLLSVSQTSTRARARGLSRCPAT